jgi:type II secretory pathway component PulK
MKKVLIDNFRRRPRQRGTILIVTIVVIFTMAMIVLVMCRTTATEVMASANQAAMIQAEAVERGAEQYAIGLLETAKTSGQPVLSLTEDYFAGIQVGEGYFWFLRPNYGDQWMPAFGFVDECSKVDINTVPSARIEMMQSSNELSEIAPAIEAWRGTGAPPNGPKSDYYLSLPDPYYAKEQPFETVEELLLVYGMTPELLYGDGTAPPLGQTSFFQNSGTLFKDATLSRGLFDLFTVHGRPANVTGPNATGPRININTAPREVLRTLVNGDEGAVDNLIYYRSQNFTFGQNTNSTWTGAAGVNVTQDQICGESQRYSADILAVSGNGRAFKRVRIVIDTAATTATGATVVIKYRRDMTERGWPMDPEILTSIRNGTWAK